MLAAAGLACLPGISVFFSCRRTDGPPAPDEPEIQLPAGQVRTNISGQVLDNGRQPVAGALVRAGSATATTDAYGNFHIEGALLKGEAALVRVEKSGFFEGSRTIMAETGGDYAVTIQLIPRTVSLSACMGIDYANYKGMSGTQVDYSYRRGIDNLTLTYSTTTGTSLVTGSAPGFTANNNFLIEFNAVPGNSANPTYRVTRFAVNKSPYNNFGANYRLRSDSMTFLIKSYGAPPHGYLKANYYGFAIDSNNLAAGRFFIQGNLQIKTPN